MITVWTAKMTDETDSEVAAATSAVEPDPAPASAADATAENPHVAVDGDAAGGWIAQVHTGEVAHVFTCMADSLEAAKAEVMRLYAEATKDSGRVRIGGGAIHYGDAKEADGASGAA
jgi:hypothetical protein